MTNPNDLRLIADLTRLFARQPQYLFALRNFLVPGSRSASQTLRPTDVVSGPGGLDAMDVELMANSGLLMRYKDLKTTHRLSAAPDDGLCLTPFALSWLHATDEELTRVGKRFLSRTEVASFTIDPATKSRKPVKVLTWCRVRSVHVSRVIHEIASNVAARAIERST